MRRLPWLPAAVVAMSLAACQPDTVRVTYRPEAGTTYRYEVRVHSLTLASLGDGEPQRTEEDAVLHVEHRVLDAEPDGPVRVQVRLRRPNSAPRTLVVRLDRAARLETVETIEGVPTTTLGELGLTEIFPAAAGAPPDRALRPGETWVIDEPVALPGTEPSRLAGEGRLAELGVIDGREVASIFSRTRLPVTRTTGVRQGTLQLRGNQVTESTARHDLSDGAVQRANSVTTGRFRVLLSPPPGRSGAPLEGRLEIEVRSRVRRLR